MALISGVAAITGLTAATSYLDAKYHVSKDLKTLSIQKRAGWALSRAVKNKRIDAWYQFEDQARKYASSDMHCIWTQSGTYTWSDVYNQSLRYAQFFIGLGIEPGELCAFYLTNHPEFIFAYLGTWAAGTAPAMINYNLGGDALIHCLKISGVKVMIIDEDDGCRARIEESRARIEQELGIRIVTLDGALKSHINALKPERPGDHFRDDMKPEFPMCLLYTSGSTGHPKACSFEMQRAHDLGTSRIRDLGLKAGPNGDRWYDCMPLYHGTGNTTAVTCLLGGMTLCIGKKFSTSGFWRDIRASHATAFVYVGETARYLLNQPPSPQDKNHKVWLMYGNGMRPDVWLKFQERFGVKKVAEFFNSTEGVFTLINVAGGPFKATAVGHHGVLFRNMLRNVYIPVEIDPDTEEIARDPKTGWGIRKPYEEGGEIVVKIPNKKAFVGYWKNEAATEKKFVQNLFEKGDLYYRSGDALRRNSDGLWYFMDRLGDTFRWKSENVSTQEVSEALGHYPGISEAMVYGVEVPGHDGRAGCAAIYIEPSQRSNFDFTALHAYLRAKLPKYAVPVFLRLMVEYKPMHNNKPNKVPYKKAGIDLDKIAADVADGGQPDKLLWCPSAVGNPSAATKESQAFVEFTKADAESFDQKRSSAKL